MNCGNFYLIHLYIKQVCFPVDCVIKDSFKLLYLEVGFPVMIHVCCECYEISGVVLPTLLLGMDPYLAPITGVHCYAAAKSSDILEIKYMSY